MGIALVVALALAAMAVVLLPAFVGGAWSPTPMRVVRQALRMAEFEAGECLADLGAGDGRVVLHAVAHYPIKAVAVEVDPFKAAVIRWRIRLKGFADRARVERRNFFEVDLSSAHVVFAYLSPAAVERLSEKFQNELPAGARVISYRRPIPGWRPWKEASGLYVYRMEPDDGAHRQSAKAR